MYETALVVLSEVVNLGYFATLDFHNNVLVKAPIGMEFTDTALEMLVAQYRWLFAAQKITAIVVHPIEKNTFVFITA